MGGVSHPDGHNREKGSHHIEAHLAFTSLPLNHHTLEPTLETQLLTPWGPAGMGWGADPRGPSDLLPFPEHTVNCPAWQRLLPRPLPFLFTWPIASGTFQALLRWHPSVKLFPPAS